MRKKLTSRPVASAALASVFFGGALLFSSASHAQMVTGTSMKDFDKTFGVDSKARHDARALLAHSTPAGNVLIPGEQPRFEIQLQNTLDTPLQISGKIEAIAYGTRGIPGDIWTPETFRIAVVDAVPVTASIAAKGMANIAVSPKIPARFGGYALVADFGPRGRQFITSFVRTFAPTSQKTQYPTQSLDELPLPVLKRLGVQAIRSGVGYKPTTDPDFEEWYAQQGKRLKELHDANVTVLLMAGAGAWFHPNQPLGRPRPWLNDKGVMLDTKTDIAWLPSYDADFQKFCRRFSADYGWPKGPITAFSLWNEPWEGISISGWGADMLRYRDIYRHMIKGVQEARAEAGVDVLTGGLDSSSNAFDKLFSNKESTEEFLPTFDFLSVHYQGLHSMANVKLWRDRQSPRGRVRIWDTESWVANTDDRVAAVVASNRAAGYDRAMGIYGGNVAYEAHSRIRRPDGKEEEIKAIGVWSTAAAIGASQHFIGERPFQKMMFTNGLPWVMMFGGKDNAEDGTIIVVGDLGEVYGAGSVLYRTARGTAEMQNEERLRREMAALPADDTAGRAKLQAQINRFETLSGATMTLRANGDNFSLFDPYGNVVPAKNGRIVVPLDGRGFFLRGNGKAGSFAKLTRAVQEGLVQGIEPLATVARDFTAPIASNPVLRLELTNVLNRPVSGRLTLAVGDLKVQAPQTLSFAAHETKMVPVQVLSSSARADNMYPLSLEFNAGKDGSATHQETLRVNLISRKTMKVDGDLNDWSETLPYTVTGGASGPSLTEAAWFPFRNFDASVQSGLATGYMAYDDTNFYFAAKAADSTPEPGMPRFETLDDSEFFYPEVSYASPRTTGAGAFRARWSGQVLSRGAGKTTFFVESDDGSRLYIDDKLVIDNWRDQGPNEVPGTVELEANKRYNIRIEYYQGGGGSMMRFSWQTPGGPKEVVPTANLFPANAPATQAVGTGLTGEFFRGSQFDTSLVTRLDPKVDFDFSGKSPDPAFDSKELEALKWPEGVRRYSYRKDPDLPAGNFPGHDNVQIAFNVLPEAQKPWLTQLPGLPAKFTAYIDTDYEYALNPVAAKYGGGTEVWRMRVPGMSPKHHYPRQPKSEFDGPVKAAQLVIRREGNTRFIEAAIPWSELPHVKQALDAGQNVKFSFRVNDNAGGGTMELSRERSVAKQNASFRVDWIEHWANELEFGWGK
jgi:hypothetical protein